MMADVNKMNWEQVPFPSALDALRIARPKKILTRNYAAAGKIPIIDQGQRLIAGWTDDESAVIRDNLPIIVFGDHTRYFKFIDFPFAVGADGTQLLKPKDTFNPRFFYYACLSVPLPNRGYNRHFSILKEQVIPRPSKPEQEKIAAVLWKGQQAIEVEERLIAAARELKRSALHQLFTRGLRGETQKETEIGPIPKGWEIRPFEELREFLQYGTSAKCDYHGKGNPVIRIPNVVDGRIDATDLKWCELTDREISSLELGDGDVLFVRTNGVRERVGTCSVYHGEPDRALFASYLIRARLKADELNPDFFQYYTMTEVGASFLAGRASPAADGKFNINTKTIDAAPVVMPSSEASNDQDEIVRILKSIDRKISVHESKRAALKELFKALLHKLMTGEIRVGDLDIDTTGVSRS